MSMSKFVETTSRTPSQKGQLKWAYLSFWGLENDMRKSLFRYERCQALPAGKKSTHRESTKWKYFLVLMLSYQFKIYKLVKSVVDQHRLVAITHMWGSIILRRQLYPNMKSCFTATSLLPCKKLILRAGDNSTRKPSFTDLVAVLYTCQHQWSNNTCFIFFFNSSYSCCLYLAPGTLWP